MARYEKMCVAKDRSDERYRKRSRGGVRLNTKINCKLRV